MRIILLNPYFSRRRQFGALSSIMSVGKPLNLGMLGGYLEANGVEVKILDGQVVNLDRESLVAELKEFQPQVVGITCMTTSVPLSHHFASLLKEIDPDLRIILGGVHPTIYPEEFLKDENIDLVIRGEGEVPLFEVLRRWEKGLPLTDLAGVSYRQGGGYQHNPVAAMIMDLDSLPLFPYHLFQMDRYDAKLQLLTSRGCPFDCIFCSVHTVMGRGFRAQSAGRVLEEIDLFVDKYGLPKRMWFADDTFVVDKKRTYKFCDMMIERGYNRSKWIINSRVDLLNRELVEKMKKAGCVQINLGIETASQRLLDRLKKGTTVEQNEAAVRMLRDVGIKARATLMLGIPGETREESLKTVAYADKLDVDQVRFSIATPYPGTELWDIAVREGMDPDVDWSRMSSVSGYSDYDPLYVPPGRDPKDLQELQNRAHLRFYFRPRNLVRFKFLRLGEISWEKFFQFKNLIRLPFLAWSLLVKKRRK